AMVEPVLRRYAPQRKAMQLSTVLPNDVEATYRLGMAKSQMIGNVTESVLRLGQQILDTKIKTESEAAEAAYVREMASYIDDVRHGPLAPESGETPWWTAPDEFSRLSRQVKDVIATRIIKTEAGRRRFVALTHAFDQRAFEEMNRIRRDKMMSMSRTHLDQTLHLTNDPNAGSAAIEEAVDRGLRDPTKAIQLEAEHHERIDYDGLLRSARYVASNIRGGGVLMSRGAFE